MQANMEIRQGSEIRILKYPQCREPLHYFGPDSQHLSKSKINSHWLNAPPKPRAITKPIPIGSMTHQNTTQAETQLDWWTIQSSLTNDHQCKHPIQEQSQYLRPEYATL